MNRSKLNTLINKLADEKFEYGKTDCFLFTNALVKAYHGQDFRSQHKYKSKKQADEYIAQYRGGIEELTTGTLGTRVKPTHCIEGDVVSAMVAPDQIALGFVLGDSAVFKTPKKVVKIPLEQCRMGWRIL